MQPQPTTAPPGMTLRDYFARTYVVNLPHRTDRRRLMVRELRRIGLPEEPGRVDFYPAIRPDDPGPFTGIGVRGCFLSHLAILKAARDQNLRNVLVLEDDLETAPALATLEPALVRFLSERPWGLTFFFPPGMPGDPRPAVTNGEPLTTSNIHVKGTHFYAVNGPTIGPVVAFLEEVLARPSGDPRGGPMHLDGAYNVFRKTYPDVITLFATTDLSGQRSSRSDVAGGRWFDSTPGVRSLATLARHVKHRLKGR
ncbi:MAG TPA: glycosyltransferase family 25 protein [Tepidisphaeraceae bacterium]|nr:glycosyltransferase family 25 protein [Tepidisphaeraceae bacterium]